MLTFTDRAREVVRSFLDQSGGELDALRISRQQGPGSDARYDLTLVGRAERSDEEREFEGEDFPVLVQNAEAERLEGATVDYVERVNESGFEVRTLSDASEQAAHNAPRPAPTGEVADRVREVLDAEVNPAIAAHGGMISLVDVEGTEISVEMSGGCQGCALSRMTLRQGVERMLREAVPQLTAVHDVTDHDSGENPFFQH